MWVVYRWCVYGERGTSVSFTCPLPSLFRFRKLESESGWKCWNCLNSSTTPNMRLSSTHHNISLMDIWTVSHYCPFLTLTSSYSKVVINPFIFKFSHKVQLQVYYNIVLQHTAAVCSAQAHWRQYSFMLLLLLSVKMRCVPWRESEMREEKLWKHQREMAFRGPKRGRKGTILRRWIPSEHCEIADVLQVT